MKIYEIGTGYTPIPAQIGAATEIVVEELVKSFQKMGVDVELVDIQAKERAANDLPLTEVKVPGLFWGTDVSLGVMHKLKRVVYSVALAGKLKKILKSITQPVVFHFHNQYNLFFFLKLVNPKLRQKARIAYTVHSYIWPGEWEEIRDTVQKRYFQEIYCVQNADDVLVFNDKTAEHFVRHLNVPANRIRKVVNGVNTDVYHVLAPEETEAFKESIGLGGKRLIFQVGSVCDRKNQLGAVKLLKDYLKKNPDVVYTYAGGVIDPECQEKIYRFAAANGIEDQIKYIGELCPGVELNRYYNAASVMVFPSKIESFGLVIIESLSAGTPVLVAQEPLFELKHGYSVYSSSDEFVRMLHDCMDGQTLEPETRNEVIAFYGWDKVARDHLTIWNAGVSV